MEDVARLAVIEQKVGPKTFKKVLFLLLHQLDHILDNCHDFKRRTLKTIGLKKALEHEEFREYLKYIGFQSAQSPTFQILYTFPMDKPLLNIHMAKTAIERKMKICYGVKNVVLAPAPLDMSQRANRNRPELKPVNIQSKNILVRKIQKLFNDVLRYENEELQVKARQQIPYIELQLKAIERVRDHQNNLKSGKISGEDLSFELALLMELMGWFKYKFFTWVDEPVCEKCGGPTKYHRHEILRTELDTCTLEIYKCTLSNRRGHGARFPRYNNPTVLLHTRRGRCGEWANCFALFCRCLSYDTRYVYDNTDHVWCEVYDQPNARWLHVDPCELTIDAPLTYCCGWGKQISYVIAVSRDDVQDVTWRYTTDHAEVLKRRTLCPEDELVDALMSMRYLRQMLVSELRRKFLAKRCIKELVHLMVERKPEEGETGGRISGAIEWRKARKEIAEGYSFKYDSPGYYAIEYVTSEDRYEMFTEDEHYKYIYGFENGCWTNKSIFRMLENDWGQVYLSREENEELGSISWRLAVAEGLSFDEIVVGLSWECFGDGTVTITLQFDGDEPTTLTPSSGNSASWRFNQEFKQAVLRVEMAGGSGHIAWQQAQLFRQPVDVAAATMRLAMRVVDTDPSGEI